MERERWIERRRNGERRVDTKELSNVSYLLCDVPIATNLLDCPRVHLFLVPPFSVVHGQ